MTTSIIFVFVIVCNNYILKIDYKAIIKYYFKKYNIKDYLYFFNEIQ